MEVIRGISHLQNTSITCAALARVRAETRLDALTDSAVVTKPTDLITLRAYLGERKVFSFLGPMIPSFEVAKANISLEIEVDSDSI